MNPILIADGWWRVIVDPVLKPVADRRWRVIVYPVFITDGRRGVIVDAIFTADRRWRVVHPVLQPITDRVGLPPLRRAVVYPVLELPEPLGEREPVLIWDGRVDERVGEQLAALLDVDPVPDRVGQDLGDEAQVAVFCLAVTRAEEGQVGEEVAHGRLLALGAQPADVPWE